MSDDRISDGRTESPAWTLPAMVVLGLIAIGGLAVGWSASSKLDGTQQAVAAQLKTAEQTMQQDMASLKDRLAQDEKTNTDLQGDLKVVTGKLKITQGQLKKAREEASKLNDATTEKLTALDTSVHSELATKATSDDVKTVDTKVVGVKTDLDATREDLKMARSEMGTLIARNHDEIDQLRRLGERDYVEFTIVGRNKPQKVGNVTVELKGVNEKRSQFSRRDYRRQAIRKEESRHERADLLLPLWNAHSRRDRCQQGRQEHDQRLSEHPEGEFADRRRSHQVWQLIS